MAGPKAENRIGDLGEKIGGARKDRAYKTGPKRARGEIIDTDPRAGWERRYVPLQNLKDGTWDLADTAKKGRFGVAMATRQRFPTEDAARAHIPLAAVARNHRVTATYPKGPDGKTDYTKPSYEIWREVTDRKRVKVVDQAFSSQVEALQHMASNAVKIIETKTSFGEEILAKPEKVYRTGPQTRAGDIAGEAFMKSLGFRGVEFGNWQHERQGILNHAYDAMHDLARATGIAPSEVSLKGQLGVAFGARGQGLSGARAHYERDYGAMNLTKMQGAGSMAHEWGHALDHFLARIDDPKLGEMATNQEGHKVFKAAGRDTDFASHRVSSYGKGELPPAVRDAYKDLVSTLYHKPQQYVEDAERAEKFVAARRDALKESLDRIRKGLATEQQWGKKKAPATPAQLAKFDDLAGKILAGELETKWTNKGDPNARLGARGSMIYRHTNDTLEAIGQVMKEVRGRAGWDSQNRRGPLDEVAREMQHLAQREKMRADATAQSVKTKMVPTEFAMNATRIDQGRASDYWSTKHEMVARAFSAYVEDKLKSAGQRSDYLSYGSDNRYYAALGMKPFPAGEERALINAKFDKLFNAMREAAIVKAGPSIPNTVGATTDIAKAMKSAQGQMVMIPESGATLSPGLPDNSGKSGNAGWSDNARAASADVRKVDVEKPLGPHDPVPGITDEATKAADRARADERFQKTLAETHEKIRATLTARGDAEGLARFEKNLAEFEAKKAGEALAPLKPGAESYGENKIRAEARASLLNKDGSGWKVERTSAGWTVQHDGSPAAEPTGHTESYREPMHEVRNRGDSKKHFVYENGKPIKDAKGNDKWFGTREKAEAYLKTKSEAAAKLVGSGKPAGWSDAARAASAEARKATIGDNGAPDLGKLEKAAEKLEAVAKRTAEKSEKIANQPRLMNTARRARLGSGVIDAANAEKAHAQTALKIAEALRRGEAGNLTNVKSLADVRALASLYRGAMYNADRVLKRPYEGGRAPTPADIAHAQMPSAYIRASTSDVEKYKQILPKGFARDLATIEKFAVAAERGRSFGTTDERVIEATKRVAKAVSEKGGRHEKWHANKILEEIRDYDRVKGLGIDSPEKLKAVLTDYVNARVAKSAPDPVAAAERNLIGMKIPGFFPTPKSLAERMADLADIKSGMTVLEPSAGTGRLADAAKAKGAKVDAVEMHSSLRDILTKKGHTVIEHDFTSLDAKGKYDRIMMNPPFEKGQDIEHVRRAYEMLKPGGKMVAIMGEGAFFRGDSKATEFRNWLAAAGGNAEKLPEGTFKESNTGVNTRLVTISKPADVAGEAMNKGWSDAARTASAEARGVAAPGEAKPAAPVQSAVDRALARSAENAKTSTGSTLTNAVEKGLGKIGTIAMIAAPVAAAAVAYDATKSSAQAAGADGKTAQNKALAAGAVAGGTTAAIGYGIAKVAGAGLKMLAKAAPAAAGPAGLALMGGLTAYGAVKAYQKHGIKGAAASLVGVDVVLDHQAEKQQAAAQTRFNTANQAYAAMQTGDTGIVNEFTRNRRTPSGKLVTETVKAHTRRPNV